MQSDNGRLRVVDGSDLPESEAELGETLLPRSSDDDVTAPSPGRYIREQRQRRGLSVEQLSVATKIPRASLELLEADRFEELPGPVFVKGFLRCSARALGLDPDAVMELLYEKERAALHARRRERPAAGIEASPEPAPRRVPPRVRRSAQAALDASTLQRLSTLMPSPAMLLWLVIAALVAMLALGAFNLMGSSPAGPTT